MRDHLITLRKETETTIRVMYALQKFNLSLENTEYVNSVNKNVHFWIIFESSLIMKLFIGIRRLFEGKNDTFNFHKFIKYCKENIEDFSIEALEKRKLKESKTRPYWIDDYLIAAHVATDDDFHKLSKLVKENSKKMKVIYTDAASKIFAHAVHTDSEIVKEILDKLNFEEIETSLKSLWHVYEQVWQMYENGRQPSFIVSSYPHKEEVYDSVFKQLKLEA